MAWGNMSNLNKNNLDMTISEQQVILMLVSVDGCDLWIKERKILTMSEEVAVIESYLDT